MGIDVLSVLCYNIHNSHSRCGSEDANDTQKGAFSIMKKLISVLLIAAMLLCSVPALAGSLTTGKGFTVELSVDLNGNSILQYASMMGGMAGMDFTDVLNSVVSIVSNTKIKYAAKGDASQIDVTVKNKPLISLGIGPDKGGYTMVCDLIPTYAFHLSAETMEQMTREITKTIPANIDVTAVTNALLKPLDELITSVSQKVGAPESGSYTVDGITFNSRIPVNITQKDAQLMLMNYAKQVLAEPAVANLVKQAGDFDPATIDQAIAEVEQYGSDDPIPVEIYGDVNMYGVASKTYAVITIDYDTKVYVGQMDNRFVAKMVREYNNDTISLDIEDTEKGSLASLRVKDSSSDVYLKSEITDRNDGGFDSKTDVFINNMSFGTVYLNVHSGANITLSATTNGRDVIPFEQLASGGSSSQEFQNFQQALVMTAVPLLLSRAQDAMPSEMNSIMSLFNGALGGMSMF